MGACVTAIEYYLPEGILDNEQLAAEFVDWSAAKIEEKTGIVERRIADSGECASDLAEKACLKLLSSGVIDAADIDYLLLCTQSPDYFLPTTACLLQSRLNLSTRTGALDFNLGCSGYVYGLGLAKGLIETGQARNVLLVTAETYSKFIHPGDRSVRTIFGDAAAATLVQEREGPSRLGPFVYGTDGRGAGNLIVPTGGARCRSVQAVDEQDRFGNIRNAGNLYMNGAEIFTFTLQSVPKAVQQLLQCSSKTLEDFDLVVFHQANQYMLEHLRKKMKIAPEKFYVALRTFGNTVSATIPIALKDALEHRALAPGTRVLLVGFGVGYSWGAAALEWC